MYLLTSNALRVLHRVSKGPWRRRASRDPSSRRGHAVPEAAVEGTRRAHDRPDAIAKQPDWNSRCGLRPLKSMLRCLSMQAVAAHAHSTQPANDLQRAEVLPTLPLADELVQPPFACHPAECCESCAVVSMAASSEVIRLALA